MPVIKRYFKDLQDIGNSLNSVNDYVEDDYYNIFLTPGDFVGTGTQGIVGDLASINFPNASTTTSIANFYIPTYWTNGYLSVDMYWSSSSDTSGNFAVDLIVNKIATEVAPGSATAVISSGSVTVLADSNTTLSLYETDTTSNTIGGESALGSFSISRQGGHLNDTSTAVFQFHGVNITYHFTDDQ